MLRTAALLVLAASTAHAGGLTLPGRGVRTLARGGAFVAGADDADALWQNPAGLAHGAGKNKRSLLFDVALVYQPVEHERIDAGGNLREKVTNEQPGTLVPALAGSLGIDDRLVIAGGISSPYTAFHRYAPDGPQRYAAISDGRGGLDGSYFVVIGAGVAYKVTSRLRVGATIQNLVSKTAMQIVANGCPGTMTCGAEDAGFDMKLTIDQTDAVSPGGSIGVQYDAIADGKQAELTLGLVLQSPMRVAGKGTLALELPASPIFDNASVIGDAVAVAMTLPATIRGAVEYRPSKALRVEAALDVELWSLHDEVAIEPEDVVVDGVAGGPFTLSRMTIPRDYKTTVSPSIAIEWHGPQIMLGAGYAYETAGAPARTVSVAAVDAAKHLIGIGGGYEDGGWQIGGALGFVALDRVDVPLADAAVGQLAPLRTGPAQVTNVNAGSYRSRYLVAGLRFARRW